MSPMFEDVQTSRKRYSSIPSARLLALRHPGRGHRCWKPAGQKLRAAWLQTPILHAKELGNGYEWMMTNSFGSMRSRYPDVITEELVVVLSEGHAFESQALFGILLGRLRAKRKVHGSGQEMLRLQVHEKLRKLVQQGRVEKTVTKLGKEYRGLASLAVAQTAVVLMPPQPV